MRSGLKTTSNMGLERIVTEAKNEQNRLAEMVVFIDKPPFNRSLVMGVDVSYSESMAVGCVAVMDASTSEIIHVEKRVAECKTPYIPGFFNLREGPILLDLLRNVRFNAPILIDANGVLHPRRLGLASYVGTVLDKQTIGVAKSQLLGEIGLRDGNKATITHAGEILGYAVWLDGKTKPVYVSVGNRITLGTAVEIVQSVTQSGIIKPLHKAHVISREVIRELGSVTV